MGEKGKEKEEELKQREAELKEREAALAGKETQPEERRQNNKVVVYRKKGKDEAKTPEEIVATINRNILAVLSVLEKYDTVVLDARRQNISLAVDVGLSRKLENHIEVVDTKISVVEQTKKQDGVIVLDKRTQEPVIMRMSSIQITLKKK